MRCKKCLSVLLAAIVMAGAVSAGAILTGPRTVYAEETGADKESEVVDTRMKELPNSTEEKEKAKEAAHEMTIATNELTGWPQGPKTYGEGGIVMDAETGAILYAKNIDGKAYPASITKVLTMLIALENAKVEDTVTVTQASVDCVEYGYAHIALKPDEKISLKDALNALMLASANEAAYAIGESVGQGYDWFIKEMNERTRELGGMNSNFLNTNGMDAGEHYTCARDMALITRELLKHPEFEEICQTLQYTIPATNKSQETRTFQQRHEMFYLDNGIFEVTAGKTGYTDTALNTLVTCADDGNRKLICVVLKTHGRNVYSDTKALLNYGFENFQNLSIQDSETSKDIKTMPEDAHVVVPEGVTFDKLKMELVPDAEEKGRAKAVYTYEGNPAGEVDVELSEEYMKANGEEVTALHPEDGEQKPKEETGIPVWVFGVLGGFGVLIAALIVWILIVAHIRKKRREERRRRRELERKRRVRKTRRKEMHGYRNESEEGSRNAERRRRPQHQRGNYHSR